MRKLIGVGVVALSLAVAGSAMAANGASLYKSKCLPCHGADGAGTAMAPGFQGNAFLKSASNMPTWVGFRCNRLVILTVK